MLRIVDITAPDINNGNGIRVTLWVAGCTNHCKGCHNAWTWDYEQGRPFNKYEEDIKEQLANWLSRDYVQGLTISGGDPMCQDAEALRSLISLVAWMRDEFPTKDIWLYTGLTLESIKENPKFKLWEFKRKRKIMAIKHLQRSLISHVDVLVDGPYIEEKRDVVHCPFRGSTNQRIIYMKDQTI